MTIVKHSRVTAGQKVKLVDRWKSGIVCDVFYENNVRYLEIKWNGEFHRSKYLPCQVREIKTIDSEDKKNQCIEQKRCEFIREKRAFDEADLYANYNHLPVSDCEEEEITNLEKNRTIRMKLEFKRFSELLPITPAMKAQINLIKNEIFEVKLKDEDYDMVMANLVVYNEIYAQVRSRMKMRSLNEFSGELAVLDARINTRSLMCRALTQLKERVNDAPFAFGCQIKPLKLDNLIVRDYPESEATFDSRRVDSGHRVVDC
jgi:hypothetical protein